MRYVIFTQITLQEIDEKKCGLIANIIIDPIIISMIND